MAGLLDERRIEREQRVEARAGDSSPNSPMQGSC